MKIDVVVVNWNAGAYLQICLDSLRSHDHFIVNHLVVVDNNSSDHSMDKVASRYGAQIIHSKVNLGFGKACNLGAKQGISDYLLFLNPDAAVYADTLPKSLAFMQDPANAAVGICGVQLLNGAGHIAQSCARFPTPLGFAAHAVGLVRLFPRLGHVMTDWAHNQTQEVGHVIGAFYLVRRSVFEQIGGFDERFFLYLEDLDFSFRAQQAGWRSVYLAHVQAFHAGGGTSDQIKARRLFYSLRSRLLYAFKHFSMPGALLVLLATLLIEPWTRTAFGLLRRSWSTIMETWNGYAMLWRWLPQWMFKGVTR